MAPQIQVLRKLLLQDHLTIEDYKNTDYGCNAMVIHDSFLSISIKLYSRIFLVKQAIIIHQRVPQPISLPIETDMAKYSEIHIDACCNSSNIDKNRL